MMLRFLLLMMLLLARPFAAHAKDPRDPVALIASVYKADTGEAKPPSSSSNKIYSRRLEALFDADEKATPEGEVGAIDFDFLVNGQDDKLSKLKIALMSNSVAQAKVRVTFNNFKIPNVIIFDLVKEDGEWRIDEITSLKSRRWVISKILSHAPDAFPDEKK
ncbi:MAG: DUF3828 domain-containing protein [Hyphomicrobiales bacterium]|nr:DUF3828 domain-containing protein [Hyphomicrobiales bacterium]